MLANVPKLRPTRIIPIVLRTFGSAHPNNSVRSVTQIATERGNGKTQGIIPHLKERGLIAAVTNDTLETELSSKKLKIYCGADPTAASLHVGNLLPLLVMLHLHLRGHDVVGLVGGATGEVGDPSGRTTERNPLESSTKNSNVERIQQQMDRFFANGVAYARSRGFPVAENADGSPVGRFERRNNYEWWKDVKMLDFLASFGRFFRIGQMIARDSVKARLDSPGGLGFNEFTYQILQAYDFWHLYDKDGVTVQVGGSDQWGNITAGIDLITKMRAAGRGTDRGGVYGLTVSLLTTSSGAKFGKSMGNAVFIDPEVTPAFQLYQFFVRSADADVEKYLRIFTLLPLENIRAIMEEHSTDPERRIAQRTLAREFCDLVYGLGTGDRLELVSSVLYPTAEAANEEAERVAADEVIAAFKAENMCQEIPAEELSGKRWSAVLARVLGVSRKEAKRLLAAGGVYVGYKRERLADPTDSREFSAEQLEEGKLLLLRIGKQRYEVVAVTGNL